jgi:hypothetical protein
VNSTRGKDSIKRALYKCKEARDDSFINIRGNFTSPKKKMTIRSLALVLLCKYPAIILLLQYLHVIFYYCLSVVAGNLVYTVSAQGGLPGNILTLYVYTSLRVHGGFR